MKYELNDKPGILPMLMYGLQWWIVSLPCVVIMGIIVSQLHYTDVAEQTFYLQKDVYKRQLIPRRRRWC